MASSLVKSPPPRSELVINAPAFNRFITGTASNGEGTVGTPGLLASPLTIRTAGGASPSTWRVRDSKAAFSPKKSHAAKLWSRIKPGPAAKHERMLGRIHEKLQHTSPLQYSQIIVYQGLLLRVTKYRLVCSELAVVLDACTDRGAVSDRLRLADQEFEKGSCALQEEIDDYADKLAKFIKERYGPEHPFIAPAHILGVDLATMVALSPAALEGFADHHNHEYPADESPEDRAQRSAELQRRLDQAMALLDMDPDEYMEAYPEDEEYREMMKDKVDFVPEDWPPYSTADVRPAEGGSDEVDEVDEISTVAASVSDAAASEPDEPATFEPTSPCSNLHSDSDSISVVPVTPSTPFSFLRRVGSDALAFKSVKLIEHRARAIRRRSDRFVAAWEKHCDERKAFDRAGESLFERAKELESEREEVLEGMEGMVLDLVILWKEAKNQQSHQA